MALTHFKGALTHLMEGCVIYMSLQTKVLAFFARQAIARTSSLLSTSTMNLLRFGLLALALGAASCATIANETPEPPPKLGPLQSTTYLQCVRVANGRVAQAPCIQNELAWQKDQLNKLHNRLASLLKAEQRTALETSQAAWAAQMTLENRFAQSVYDPQGLDFEVMTNEIMWTVQRRQQLQRYLSVIE